MTPNTALTVHRSEPTAIARPAAPQTDFAGLFAVAEALVPTGFLPQHIQNAGQAVAIILAGQELGMPPMRALRSLRMVKGNVTEAADSMLARFKTDGGRAQFLELTEERAVLELIHPNGDRHTETFTIADAQRAGLAGNGGMYQKFPKAMLRSRVITAGLKSLGWEGGAGVYDPSEFETSPPVTAPAPAAYQPPAPSAREVPAREMTLDEALNVPLLGKPESWGGKGGQPIGTLSPSVLAKAEAFFAKKYKEKLDATGEHDERMYEQMQALALVLPFKATQDAELPAQTAPIQSGEAGVTMKGGRVSDALPLDEPVEPKRGRDALREG